MCAMRQSHDVLPILIDKAGAWRLQDGEAAAAFSHPRITLVAHLVNEADFSRVPEPDAVRAGAQTVRFVLAHG